METIKNKMKNIIQGLMIAILFTIIALSLFSIILVNTNIAEETIEPVVLIVSVISISIGSSIVAKRVKESAILSGGAIGFLYIILCFFLSSIVNSNFSLNPNIMIMMSVGIISGIFGGIAGINISFLS